GGTGISQYAICFGKSYFLVTSPIPSWVGQLTVQQTGMAAGSVSGALLQLELMGLVSQLPGMRYQKS
ncbi:MAG: hypothetical protein V7K38_29405, partial [Nostoc sp.]